MKAVLAQVVSCCVFDKWKKIIQDMHDNVVYMFDCCADPVVHLLLLKRFMVWQSNCDSTKLTEATSSTRILIWMHPSTWTHCGATDETGRVRPKGNGWRVTGVLDEAWPFGGVQGQQKNHFPSEAKQRSRRRRRWWSSWNWLDDKCQTI